MGGCTRRPSRKIIDFEMAPFAPVTRHGGGLFLKQIISRADLALTSTTVATELAPSFEAAKVPIETGL
jgi:hypothetical protein